MVGDWFHHLIEGNGMANDVAPLLDTTDQPHGRSLGQREAGQELQQTTLL